MHGLNLKLMLAERAAIRKPTVLDLLASSLKLPAPLCFFAGVDRLWVRIEKPQGSGDDTALNNIRQASAGALSAAATCSCPLPQPCSAAAASCCHSLGAGVLAVCTKCKQCTVQNQRSVIRLLAAGSSAPRAAEQIKT